MSEQRFKLIEDDDDFVLILDVETGKKIGFNSQVVQRLNEQQATIQSLQTELELISGEKLFSRRELERKVDEQQSKIDFYQSRVNKREEQISIMKKHLLANCSDEQVRAVWLELEKTLRDGSD